MERSLLLSVSIIAVVATSLCYGQPPVDRRECVKFTHSYCNKFNYSTAIFPNPRGHETPEEAAEEFKDFNTLLHSQCHPKLGTLLCFIYFPVCNETNFNPMTDLADGFFPCRELCSEVHNSACTPLVLSATGLTSWAPHLQVNFADEKGKSFYKPAVYLPNLPDPINCINGIAPLYGDPTPNECETGAHNCHANAECTDTAVGFNCTCRAGFTGNGRDCSDVDECLAGTHGCSVNAACTNTEGGYTCTCNAGYSGDGKNCTEISVCAMDACKTCKFRANAGRKTFINNCFCYAARVIVVSSSEEDCNHVYTVTIKEQFDLKTPYNTTHATSAPNLPVDQQITVITNPTHCEKCPSLTIGQEYIIGGSYRRGEDGAVTWHLEGHTNKAVASVWVDRHTNGMGKWIQNSNIVRQEKLSCLKECEN